MSVLKVEKKIDTLRKNMYLIQDQKVFEACQGEIKYLNDILAKYRGAKTEKPTGDAFWANVEKAHEKGESLGV